MCHLFLLYGRSSLDSVLLMPFCSLTRPWQEISVCGWLTKVWVEQQPWLTEFFDPAPTELLCSALRAAVPLIHCNNPLFTLGLKPRLKHNTPFSLICDLYKFKSSDWTVQASKARTVPELLHLHCNNSLLLHCSLFVTFYFEVSQKKEILSY